MNRIFREGANLEVALAPSAGRESGSEEPRVKSTREDVERLHSVGSPSPHSGAPANISQRRLRSRIKAALRRVAKRAYRLLRPFVRPIAFRARAYFVEGLRREIETARHESSAGSHASQVAIHALQAEVVRMHHHLLQQMRDINYTVSANVIEELQAARDLLQEDLANLRRQTALRCAIHGGGEAILVGTELGYVLCPASNENLMSSLLRAREPEPGTCSLIKRLLEPGDTFVDIGSNIGLYSLAAARAMHGEGRIVAFEPDPAIGRLVERSLWFNGFSTMSEVHQIMGTTATDTQTSNPGNSDSRSSVNPSNLSTHAPIASMPAASLDEILGDEPVAVIRIDLGCAGLQILESARRTLSRNPEVAVIVAAARSGSDANEWMAVCRDFGLEFRVVQPRTGVLQVWSPDLLETVESVTLLFARPGSHVLTQG